MSGRARQVPIGLALICLAGALLRFATLDLQSLWYDEAVTADLLRMNLSGLLHAIPDSESSPPLYYLLAWLWTHVFGTGEVGLRSLPALFGTATIPVVWALGRRTGGDRAGLVAAALVAVNPMLVWFSQEARAYALLVLLAAVATLLWLRALERPSPGRAAAWSAVAALAVATHYYAIVLVAPQGLWLVLAASGPQRRRVQLAAAGPLGVALVALAPLALGQRANDSAAFIRDSALSTRILQVPKQLLVGYDAPAETLFAVLSAVVLVVAACGAGVLLVRTPRTPARDDAGRLAAMVAAALVLPVIAALAGEDHLITRNLLAVVPAAAAVAGAGLVQAARMWPGLGPAAIASACVLGLATVIGVAIDPRSQRDDWRGAVKTLGTAPGQRLIAATPASALAPLRYYLPGARELTEASVLTPEVDYIALSERSPGERPAPPRPAAPPQIPPFALIAGARGDTFTVLRMRAPTPQPLPRTTVAAGLDGKGPLLVVFTR